MGTLGRYILFLVTGFGLSFAPASASEAATIQKKESEVQELDPLYELISDREWQKVLDQIKAPIAEPFLQLIQTKALFELKNWDAVLERPLLTDTLFGPYDQYLHALAAFESKKFDRIESLQIPENLPFGLRQSLSLLKARALREGNKNSEAKRAYRDFLEQFPNSPYQSQVFLELANIEWVLENRFEALSLYEKIYTFHPLNDADNVAKERLQESGRLEELETDAHLTRIQSLKSAALFAEAIKELEQLKTQAKEAEIESLRLAIARLEFARKRYSKSEQISKAELKQASKDKSPSPLLPEWRSLYAFSLTRQGKFEDANKEYAVLLNEGIDDRQKQQILLRLGLMALDDKNFDESANYFSRLRKEFKRGRFEESAHWFEAWSIFMSEKKRREEDKDRKPDTEQLKVALELLEQLPKLPEGENLQAQAIYWRSQIYAFLGDTAKSQKLSKELSSDWQASFHILLNAPTAFDFLQFNEVFTQPQIVHLPPTRFRVPDPAFQQVSWRRVEAFAKANLDTWAQMELNRFLQTTAQKNEGLRNAVANRLIQLQDWSDLIRYAQKQFPFQLRRLDKKNETAFFFYPQSYHEEVLRFSREFQVSPFLVWGVMREESRFQADVISGAGAVGLLQLMPNLGNRIGRKLGDPEVRRADLTQPDRNIRYGTFHLKELIDQISSWDVPSHFVVPLVVASYNAGAGPVKRWVNEIGTDDLGKFVESIPYSETRGYVKRVLQSAQIYYFLYAERVKHLATKEGDTKL